MAYCSVPYVGERWCVTYLTSCTTRSLKSFRRQHRRLFHEEFNIDAQRQYHPQERAVIHALLWSLLRDSGDVKEHFRQ